MCHRRSYRRAAEPAALGPSRPGGGRSGAVAPCGPVGVLDEPERLQVVGGPGLEGRPRLEAVDEVGNDAVEARLVALVSVEALAPIAGAEKLELVVRQHRARGPADDLQAIRRPGRVARGRHGPGDGDRGA